MAKLFLQILGNSDVVVDSQFGTERLRDYSLESVRELAEINDKELIDDIDRVDFPFLREVKAQQTEELYWGIILTDQVAWLKQQEMSPEAWNEIIASDGCWWKNILTAWCEKEGLNLFPIDLKIPPSSARGAADWEDMAILIKEKLATLIHEDGVQFQLQPASPIEQILIQHSSGTPATSSALYLWGIEQKLAGKPIEFVYISRQDSSYIPHFGEQWQWRFKIPQIQQLFNIQDFGGALQLLSNYPNNEFKKNVRYLDRAVSFNLGELSDIDRSPEGKVLERIAIALWSEKAFRERGQWMHWYLRVAGAFELALLSLVQKQAPNRFQWQNNDNNKAKSELIDQENNDLSFRFSIYKIVTQLLDQGYGKDWIKNQFVSYQVTPIKQDSNWRQFQRFYTQNGWELSQNFKTGFLGVRNELYHGLQGDQIDNILDKKTEIMGSTDDPEHPAEIAIQQLHYLVSLADIADPIQKRIANYQNRVETIKEQLEWIYKSY
ncbi:MAG: hypothetical protein ACOC04_05545 [Halothece sp.]